MKPKLTIVAFPWKSNAPYKFLSEILEILEPNTKKIVLIDGNTHKISTKVSVEFRELGIGMHDLNDISPKPYSAILWLFKCIYVQFKTSVEILKSNDSDIIMFYLAYPYYMFPLIIAKILRKKTFEVVTRSPSKSILSKIMELQDPILFHLLSGISPESESLIKELNLYKYKHKILPEGYRFVDTSLYNVQRSIDERDNIIGFISRIRKEKGICEFIEAVKIIAKDNNNLKFLIAGDGNLSNWLKEEIENIIKEFNVSIEYVGWIENEMPLYLNKLKLLVLPSYTEGLPTIIIESLSCGTPVLVTSVGSVDDLIKDLETGFIIEDNVPQKIADDILYILKYDKLDNIVENALNLIEEKYTYESSVKRWEKIFLKISNS